jgi:hypothetical protein
MIKNSQTIETIKMCQERAILEQGTTTYTYTPLLLSLIDPVIDQTYGDLILRKNDFFVMSGPTGLGFHRLNMKFAVTAKTQVLFTAFTELMNDRDALIHGLTTELRAIALQHMGNGKMFAPYVPFNICYVVHPQTFKPNVIVKTRYGTMDTTTLENGLV